MKDTCWAQKQQSSKVVELSPFTSKSGQDFLIENLLTHLQVVEVLKK
jgi:hypothetical protein